jgi:outer membrane protein OmpA-like peptidoglycan-associated protein
MKAFLALLCATLLVGCVEYPRGPHALTHPALIDEDNETHLTRPGIIIEVPKRAEHGERHVELSGVVLFAFDSADISTETQRGIDSAVDLLKSASSGRVSVVIRGHASSDGDPSYNKGLSQRRAEAVSTYLTSALAKIGVTNVTFDVAGLGAPTPTRQNSTPEARRQDRNASVDISIVVE